MKLGLVIFGLLSTVAHAGKIGGGGGGTVKMPGVSHELMKNAASTSSHAIATWLAGQELKYRTGRIPDSSLEYYGKIFIYMNPHDPIPDTNDTIFGVLKDLKIEYRATRVCLDKEGHEVDASIYTSLPDKHAICLSGLRLGSQLEEDDFDYKIAAIIVHEATHLMGLGLDDDEQSRVIQRDALRGLKNFNFDDPYRTVSTNMHHALYEITFHLSELLSGLNSDSPLHDKNAFLRINEKWMQWTGAVWYLGTFDRRTAPFMPWHYSEIDRMRSVHAKFSNMVYATCVEGTYFGKCYGYEAIFNGAPGLYAQAFDAMAFHVDPHLYVNPEMFPTDGIRNDEYIPKITSMNDLKVALKDLIDELSELNDKVIEMNSFEVIEK